MLKLPVILEMFWNKLFEPLEYTLSGILVSDVGRKRTENQDNFSFGEFVNENKSNSIRLEIQKVTLPQAFGIMDGMGGEKLGAQASLEAAGFFSDIKRDILEILPKLDTKGREKVFTSLIHSLNEKVCQMALENNVKRSGTTIIAIFFVENRAYIVSVGDSRIFLIRNGEVTQQNKLDTMNITITENGVEKQIRGGLCQFLGMDASEYELVPHIVDLKLKEDDTFLLCSDGLTDYVTPEEIGEAISNKSGVSSVDYLLGLAMERGGKDNTTIIRLDVKAKGTESTVSE